MVKVIPDEKVPAFVSAADTKRHPIPLAVSLMLHTGLRVGELAHLAWCDLLINGTPLANLTLDAKMTKRHQARTVPIVLPLAERILSAWTNHANPAGFTPAGYAIAKTPHTASISVRTIERAVKSIGHKVDLEFITPHTLRHTFATRLLRATGNIRIVQAVLGHKRISTTQIYTHPNNEDLRKALDAASGTVHMPLRPPPAPSQ